MRMQAVPGTASSSAEALWRRLPQPAKEAAKTAWAAFAIMTPRSRVLPGFLIIGAQRAGTTSLYNYLCDHPCVSRALTKEVRFFDLHYQQGLDWYRSRFPSRRHMRRLQRLRGHEQLVGEASPDYLFHPHVPQRVADQLPDAKLIVLLRNPVDRAFSHYWHQVKRGYEQLSFSAAVESEEDRLSGELERMLEDPNYVSFERHHHSYLARGRYAEQLEPWLKAFPGDQILIERSEDFFDDPASILASVMAFLELPGTSTRGYQRFNAFTSGRLDPELRRSLNDYFRPHNARLTELLGRDFNW